MIVKVEPLDALGQKMGNAFIGLESPKLGGGFKDFLFSSVPGEMIQFDSYFSKGLKPLTSK